MGMCLPVSMAAPVQNIILAAEEVCEVHAKGKVHENTLGLLSATAALAPGYNRLRCIEINKLTSTYEPHDDYFPPKQNIADYIAFALITPHLYNINYGILDETERAGLILSQRGANSSPKGRQHLPFGILAVDVPKKHHPSLRIRYGVYKLFPFVLREAEKLSFNPLIQMKHAWELPAMATAEYTARMIDGGLLPRRHALAIVRDTLRGAYPLRPLTRSNLKYYEKKTGFIPGTMAS